MERSVTGLDYQQMYEEERRLRLDAEEKVQALMDAVLTDEGFDRAMAYNPLVAAIVHIAIRKYKATL